MTCPYADSMCTREPIAGADRCPDCGRFWKSCGSCHARNRAFANHCRSCGTQLSLAEGNWLAYKGGAQRLGFNAARVADAQRAFTPMVTQLNLRLGDACRSLLGYDQQLIAISRNGAISIADPHRPEESPLRHHVPGPVTCEPCIADGILYLGSPRQIAAYSLGAMTLPAPQVKPLWQVPLSGNPIQALTVAGKRLYATVAGSEGRRDVVAMDLGAHAPVAARVIHSSATVSWLAADPNDTIVVFLSEQGGRVSLHVATPTGMDHHRLALEELADHPIALTGGKVFAIFGADRRLYQIDARTGVIEETLHTDVQMFALTQDGGAWDLGGVNIHSRAIRFSGTHTEDTFAEQDRVVQGSPLIVQRRAAVVAMRNGRVRVYDLGRAPVYGAWLLEEGSESMITALASFGPYVAAGNADGIVKVLELQSKQAEG